MDAVEQQEVDQIGGIAVSHTALICALLTVLEERGLLSSSAVDDVFDIAAATLERAEAYVPVVISNARRQLDIAARSHARSPARRRG